VFCGQTLTKPSNNSSDPLHTFLFHHPSLPPPSKVSHSLLSNTHTNSYHHQHFLSLRLGAFMPNRLFAELSNFRTKKCCFRFPKKSKNFGQFLVLFFAFSFSNSLSLSVTVSFSPSASHVVNKDIQEYFVDSFCKHRVLKL
jgi:hypothetical protein